MSVKKFKFVSPGVFLKEIDNSQLPQIPAGIGPVVIGRFRKGPAMKPVQVGSLVDFENTFGRTIPGSEGDDPWREGNGLQATSPAPYAAYSYFNAPMDSQPPLTVVRLLGVSDRNALDSGLAGWDLGTNGNTYGIFVIPSTSSATTAKAFLAGTIYSPDEKFSVGVYGKDGNNQVVTAEACLVSASTNASIPVKIGSGLMGEVQNPHSFGLNISNSLGQRTQLVSFIEQDKNLYIRNKLNTNPVQTNTRIKSPPSGSLAESYWLGETFDNSYVQSLRQEQARAGKQTTTTQFVFVAKLSENFEDFKSTKHQLSPAKSGWVIGQHTGDSSTYDPLKAQKLFRIISLQDGEQGNSQYVQIENIKIKFQGDPDPYGTFSLAVYYLPVGEGLPRLQERWDNLNLNPKSSRYIARVIGDRYFEWDSAAKVNRSYNSYNNTNPYIRVDMSTEVAEGDLENIRAVPFGFLGPVVPKDHAAASGSNGEYTMSTWINGKVDLSNYRPGAGELAPTTFTVEWPTLPQVITGSQVPGGADTFNPFGGTPYPIGRGDVELNENPVLKGSCDYYRRMPESDFLTPQGNGIADANTKHSYVFSLDQIVVTGSSAVPAVNLVEWPDRTAVYHREDSHLSPAATATLTINTNRASMSSDSRFDITDAAGTTKSFIFKTAINTVDGSTNPGDRFIVGVAAEQAGLNSADAAERQAAANAVAAKIATVIGTNPVQAAIGITATAVNNVVTITQKTRGTSGNNAGGNGNFTETDDANGKLAIVNFAGGVRPGQAYTSLDQGSPTSLTDLVNSFRIPMCGGFDGVDITEMDPFNMSADALGPDATAQSSYAYASVERAIDMISDPEIVEHQLALMPGITNKTLTERLVRVCEARADSLAIIDLPNVYIPPAQEECTSFKDRVDQSSARKAAIALTERQINSSYGCAYYPWVKVRDPNNGPAVWLPPSVIALGAMAYTDATKKPWFAPAGFTRGGLTNEVVGLTVEGVSEHLLSRDRDVLYEANINPIASFVSEGLVIFGQKTLQLTQSALDRINVRRMLIFVKKRISRISSQLLFDQNVPATWARFTGQVVPFLEDVKTEFGLTDFKVVLDGTTTTPDLIDRNIMYAKIFLKPARSIEFIAIDFVITRTGAGYSD
tara:strand:+ start:1119 stop:4523 length:3405 start_codon:yes stop_codon:yes gene_type:complete